MSAPCRRRKRRPLLLLPLLVACAVAVGIGLQPCDAASAAATYRDSHPRAPTIMEQVQPLQSSWLPSWLVALLGRSPSAPASAPTLTTDGWSLLQLPSAESGGDGLSPSSSQADIVMWLHEHRDTYEWSELVTLPLQDMTIEPLSALSQQLIRIAPPRDRRTALVQPRLTTEFHRAATNTKSPRSLSHTPRELFSLPPSTATDLTVQRSRQQQVHAPVLPPHLSANGDPNDPIAAAASLLDLNDDEDVDISTPAAGDADSRRMRSELLIELAAQLQEAMNRSWTNAAASSALLYPSNITSVFRGAWSAEAVSEDPGLWARLGLGQEGTSGTMPLSLTRPPGFENEEGILMYMLRAFPTWQAPRNRRSILPLPVLSAPATARYAYVEGEVVVRDGHYTSARDLRFQLSGLYSALDGRVLLFANQGRERAPGEVPFWLSTANLAAYFPAPQFDAPFLVELSAALNRTMQEIGEWQRAKERERYRALHGEDRSTTLLRHHAALVEAARTSGRPAPPPLDVAAAEQAELDEAAAAENLRKHFSDCLLSVGFQVAPLVPHHPRPPIIANATRVRERLEADAAVASAAAAAAASRKVAPLQLTPLDLSLSGGGAGFSASIASATGNAAFATASASSLSVQPEEEADPLGDDKSARVRERHQQKRIIDRMLQQQHKFMQQKTQLRLQLAQQSLHQQQQQLQSQSQQTGTGTGGDASASAGARRDVGLGIADASMADEASSLQQHAHLAMSGFVFSDSVCPSSAAPAAAEAFRNASVFGDGAAAAGAAATMPCHACGFKLRVQATLLKIESFFAKAINYAYFASALALCQLYLLLRQMRATQSPSAGARISPYSVGMQALLDSYLCLGHCFIAMSFQPLFNAFVVTSFLEFILFSLFEMRFIFILYKAHNPVAFSQGFDQTRRAFRALYARFYGVLLGGGFVVWVWPRVLPLAVLALHGLWLPQIVHQAVTGARRGMQKRYVLGMSLLRLGLPLYYYACPTNFLSNQTSPALVFGLVAWVAAQVGVLMLQDRWGPRFFVPARFLPPRYDYFRSVPLLSLGRRSGGGGGRRGGSAGAGGDGAPHDAKDVSPEDAALSAVQLAVASDSPAPALCPAAVDAATAAAGHVSISVGAVAGGGAGAGSSAAHIGLSPSSPSDEEDENPCPICYGELDADGAGARDSIMVCPCDHMFHTPCLRRWMREKQECPVCRATLPVEENDEQDDAMDDNADDS